MARPEHHRTHRVGWLRAAVLGANDGIVSTSSLLLGVAAADASREAVFVAALAGAVAGAMSMAAGEYVSVSSQADTERADLELERRGLANDPVYELDELTNIYKERGLDDELASAVARQLTAKDALAAHARDELGLTEQQQARPMLAALASGASFSVGALIPTVMTLVIPVERLPMVVALVSLGLLAGLGALAAYAGGARIARSVARVVLWGALAMGATAGLGHLVGQAL